MALKPVPLGAFGPSAWAVGSGSPPLSTLAYAVGDCVSYLVAVSPTVFANYQCQSPQPVGSAPPASRASPGAPLVINANWRQLVGGEPVWRPTQTYYAGDIVSYVYGGGGTADEGSLFMALQTNLNQPPGNNVSTIYWKVIAVQTSDSGVLTVASSGNGSGVAVSPTSGNVLVSLDLVAGNPSDGVVGSGINIIPSGTDAKIGVNLDLQPVPALGNAGLNSGMKYVSYSTGPADSARYSSLDLRTTTAGGISLTNTAGSTTGLDVALDVTTDAGSGLQFITTGGPGTNRILTNNFVTTNGCGITKGPGGGTALNLFADIVSGNGITVAPSAVDTSKKLNFTPRNGTVIAYSSAGVPQTTIITSPSPAFTANTRLILQCVSNPADTNGVLTGAWLEWDGSNWTITMSCLPSAGGLAVDYRWYELVRADS